MTPRLSNKTDHDAEITIGIPDPATGSRPYPSKWRRLDDPEGTTGRTDDRGEPDIIVWGSGDDTISPRTQDQSTLLQPSPALRRLRRFARPLLLVAGFIAAIMMTQHAGDRVAPKRVEPPPDSAPAASAQAPQVQLRLIAPAIATPGQHIVVLAFKHAGLCTQAQLRFDGTPVQHRLTGIAGSPLPYRVEMFLDMQVPRSATMGMHILDLYDSTASGSTGSTCAHLGDQPAKLATTIIVVTGPDGSPGTATGTRNDRAPEDPYGVASPADDHAPSSVNMPARPK